MENKITQLIRALNAFDVETALTLFETNAVINDVSVGEKFKNTAGVRKYLEQFFVGYNTKTRIECVEVIDSLSINTQVDFTGNFGHETGALNFTFNTAGLIIKINAHLN